jgi:hypothetical protein
MSTLISLMLLLTLGKRSPPRMKGPSMQARHGDEQQAAQDGYASGPACSRLICRVPGNWAMGPGRETGWDVMGHARSY